MTMMPLIVPLGDCGLLIRFAETLDDHANVRAVGFARQLALDPPAGALEIVPKLVSVYLRYDPSRISFADLAAEVRLRLSLSSEVPGAPAEPVIIPTCYDGADLGEAATAAGLTEQAFIERHAGAALRVLSIGFAPGFAYCGFHEDLPPLPRRGEVRPRVPAGTVLYAAGQTAITATAIPTGWNVIGHTDFRNFDAAANPPVRLEAGTPVRFEVQ
nr:carboxyltransferase domain-containing protein [uncultured Sphaerochaeta sp.]